MKKTISLLIIISFFNLGIFAQSKQTLILSDIVKSQQTFFRKQIKKDDKAHYSSILHLAKNLRQKVVSEIQKQDSSFFSDSNNEFNLAEGYDIAHGNLYGLLWTGSDYYSYTFTGPDNDVHLNKINISNMADNEKSIVMNFGDWKNNIFSEQECTQKIGGLYYLGSKIILLPEYCIKTIAFCY